MKCPNCGSELRKGLSFCPKCGNVVSQNKQEVASAQNNQSVQPKKRISVWKIVLGILFFPIALTIIIVKNKKMKPIMKIVLIAILWIFVLVVGASNSNVTPTSNDNSISDSSYEEKVDDETATSNGSEQLAPPESEEIDNTEEVDSGVTIINDFIDAYNAVAEVQITDTLSFNPQDKESGHYRTEFRLGAWDGSVGTTASIGNSSIDIVCFGSHGGFYKNKDLRIYVTSPTTDELFEIFKIAAKEMDEAVTDEEIQEVIDHVNEYGDDNGFIIGNMEPGTIFIREKSEMMLTVNG